MLRLLIRRVVYCRIFLNAAKEANRTKQWAFKVWARAAKRRFVMALPFHPAPARCNTGPHRNNIQNPLQRRPEEEKLTWFAVVASRVKQNWSLVGVKFSTNHKILILLLNLVLVLLVLLMNLVLLLWSGVPCGSQCASGAGSKRRAWGALTDL